MKKIECIIKPYKLEEVAEALWAAGIGELIVTEVRGFGRQKGQTQLYRGDAYTVDFLPKIKLEFLVSSNDLNVAVDTIIRAARSGRIGDGKIFISNAEEITIGLPSTSTNVPVEAPNLAEVFPGYGG